MAVEAGNINLFPPQLLPNNGISRNLMNINQGNFNIYNTQMGSGLNFNGLMPDSVLPLYHPVSGGKASINNNKSDSGVTYNVPPLTRKRPRDPISDIEAFSVSQKSTNSSFLDQAIVFQIQQQQSDLDRFIANHTEKVRVEIEERRRRQSRMLIQGIQERVFKKLKEKDEEIHRIGQLNLALQERVKSLFTENQIWRDLAQSNEATANSLRNNLEIVLAQINDDRHPCGANLNNVDEAESSCGSNDDHDAAAAAEKELPANDEGAVAAKRRMCRKCGGKESSVLLLPCSHLCLCTSCGCSSLVGTCPVCDSDINASVHVNMS